ncbi:uncharacterized protein LOC135090025 [Scylla paramamosain]|uniref:uncharacterized protein LOC135090025 n=1 Tax=Scylla paramamosain TaxID=85552 RepID=UPI003082E6D2
MFLPTATLKSTIAGYGLFTRGKAVLIHMAFTQVACVAVVVTCCWLAGLSAGREDADYTPALSPQQLRDFSVDELRRLIEEAGPKHDLQSWILAVKEEMAMQAEEQEKEEQEKKGKSAASPFIPHPNQMSPALTPLEAFIKEKHGVMFEDVKETE